MTDDAETEVAVTIDSTIDTGDFGAAVDPVTVERIATALEQIAYQLKELRALLSKRMQ